VTIEATANPNRQPKIRVMGFGALMKNQYQTPKTTTI